jgi:hypothetical protein
MMSKTPLAGSFDSAHTVPASFREDKLRILVVNDDRIMATAIPVLGLFTSLHLSA